MRLIYIYTIVCVHVPAYVCVLVVLRSKYNGVRVRSIYYNYLILSDYYNAI